MTKPNDFKGYPESLRTGYGPHSTLIQYWHDGDSAFVGPIDVGFEHYPYVWIRLRAADIGIDAPEISTSEGKIALAFVESFCPSGTPVKLISELTPVTHDQVRSFIRYAGSMLMADGTDVGQKMLDSGHAVIWP